MSFEKYPAIEQPLEQLCRTRRDIVLQNMVETDPAYRELRRERAGRSMFLLKALGEQAGLLEEYTNAVYAQECYELDAIYRQAVHDTLELLSKRGLL